MKASQIIRPLRLQLLAGATSLLALVGCARTDVQGPPQASHYYLDGQPSTRQAVEALPSEKIDRMDVLSGQQARTYSRDSTATSVVLIKTKAE